MLKQAALYALIFGFQALSSMGHALLYSIKIGGTEYPGYSDTAGVGVPGSADQDRIDNCIQRSVSNDGWVQFDDPNVATYETKAKTAKTAPAKPGDDVTVTWTKWWRKDPKLDHQGPMEVYMAKCSSDCNGESGNEMQWFKTHEWGYDNAAGLWASQKLAASDSNAAMATDLAYHMVHHTFKLPTGLPKGNYLVRVNIIALQSPILQYYPRAFQISLDGDEGNVPFPTGKFPAIYTENSPRNKYSSQFNIWGTAACTPNDLMYQIPGLDVIPGGVSENSNNVALCPAAEAGVGAGTNTGGGSGNPASSSTAGGNGSPTTTAGAPSGSSDAGVLTAPDASGDATAANPAAVPSSTLDLKNKGVETDTGSSTPTSTRNDPAGQVASTAPSAGDSGVPASGGDPIAWTKCGEEWSACIAAVTPGESIAECEATRWTCTEAAMKSHRRRKFRRTTF